MLYDINVNIIKCLLCGVIQKIKVLKKVMFVRLCVDVDGREIWFIVFIDVLKILIDNK